LTAPVGEIDRRRLRALFDTDGCTPIGALVAREQANVRGEVQATRIVPRAGSPSLEVTVHDGTGSVVAVFTGRRRLGGVGPGRALVLDGVPRHDRDRLVMVNPAYTLLT
jgi:hypothetical protein